MLYNFNTVIVVVGHVESSVLFLLLAVIRDAEQPTDAVVEVGHQQPRPSVQVQRTKVVERDTLLLALLHCTAKYCIDS